MLPALLCPPVIGPYWPVVGLYACEVEDPGIVQDWACVLPPYWLEAWLYACAHIWFDGTWPERSFCCAPCGGVQPPVGAWVLAGEYADMLGADDFGAGWGLGCWGAA